MKQILYDESTANLEFSGLKNGKIRTPETICENPIDSVFISPTTIAFMDDLAYLTVFQVSDIAHMNLYDKNEKTTYSIRSGRLHIITGGN